MTALTFDTLKYAKRLREAGIPAAQAEAETEALAEALEIGAAGLLTRQDGERIESGLRYEMQQLRLEMKQLEQRMVIKLGSLMVACLSILAVVTRLS